MTEEEKKTLVDAVNCKYPHQNLTEIYYNIGRALPFTAQRFPDGRVSDWYRNQYVEVVRVEPHGRGGKFGNVFGFYYRNGERADAYENDPEHSWCTRMIPNRNQYHVVDVAHGCCWTSSVRRQQNLLRFSVLMTRLALVNIRI